MIPVERRQIILEMVAEKGIVSIAELTDRMNVSHMTIRRDLQKLEQQGAVVLVSGGVQSPGRVAHEPSHQVKTALAMTQKAAIGKLAASLVQPGLGSTVKIIHQLLAGVHIAAGAEAMALAARAGIPLDVMYDVVTNAAGNSWMFENRMRHVVDGDYTPHSAVDIFVKDLGLVADTAKALHFPLPLASTALNMFTSASNAGYGKEDDSAVIKIFSGITLPGAKS